MNEDKIAIRALLRHYWKKGTSAKAAAEQICEVEGIGIVHRNTAAIWFKRFNEGDTSLVDKPRPGRPSDLDEGALCVALEKKPHSSCRELSTTLGIPKSTVYEHLIHLDYAYKRPRQDPHQLTVAQAKKRIEICNQLLQQPIGNRFWKRIVTCDEKWIFLRNPYNRRQWVSPETQPLPEVRQDRFGHKVMLCVWWNFEGIIHFELVPSSRSVDSRLYAEQIDRVYTVLSNRYPTLLNRRRLLYQHDNAPAHRSRVAQQKLKELGEIEVLPHPAYSPDIAPSDYGLFRSMAAFLRGRQFNTFNEVESACQEFFTSKPKEWYRRQIELLAERWTAVIENDGLYFEE